MSLAAWLHAQVTALFVNAGDVASNRAVPARQVVIDTLVTVIVVWAALKIAKKFSK